MVELFEVEQIAAIVCIFLADGFQPSSLAVLPSVSPAFRTLLDRRSMGEVWKHMAERRWVGLTVATELQQDPQQHNPPRPKLPRVENWRRFFRLRYLHLRYERTNPEPLVIENCARGLEAESKAVPSPAEQQTPAGNESGGGDGVDLPDGVVWRLRCPVRPSKLEATGNSMVDHCRECQRNVYWVVDELDLRQKAERGECVYYDPGGRVGRARGKRFSHYRQVRGRVSAVIRPPPAFDAEGFGGTVSPAPFTSTAPKTSLKPNIWYSDGSTRGFREDTGRWEEERRKKNDAVAGLAKIKNCPGGCGLRPHEVKLLSRFDARVVRCKRCTRHLAPGEAVHSCLACDFDACNSCLVSPHPDLGNFVRSHKLPRRVGKFDDRGEHASTKRCTCM